MPPDARIDLPVSSDLAHGLGAYFWPAWRDALRELTRKARGILMPRAPKCTAGINPRRMLS
jgi:hypothetical protein